MIGRTEATARPNFLIIGAMKAGTTSLYHYLRPHPQVFMPKIKELDFFVQEMNWPRGWDWYEQHFTPAPRDARALGEASTVYTKFPRFCDVPARIAGSIPDVRLVYLIRDPVERIWSHYRHRQASGAEVAPLEHAVLSNPIYLDYSRYAMQIEQYLQHFAREQLLVVASETLRSERQVTMRRVYRFLGLDEDFVAPNLTTEFYRTVERRSYPPLVWAARRAIKRHFPQAKRAKEVVDSFRVRGSRRAPPGDHADEKPPAGPPRPARAHPLVPGSPIAQLLRDLLGEDVERLRSFVEPADLDQWALR